MFRRRGAHAPPVVVSKPKRVLVGVLTVGLLAGGASIAVADPGGGPGSNNGCPGHQPPPPPGGGCGP